MVVAALQGPTHFPFVQVQPSGSTFVRQSASVSSAAQSNPIAGLTTHPGVGLQPGIFWHCAA